MEGALADTPKLPSYLTDWDFPPFFLHPPTPPIQNRITLGSSVEQACSSPEDLRFAAELWHGERALLTYRPDTQKLHIMLREGSTSPDCLRAAFAAHIFLYILDGKDMHGALPAVALHGQGPSQMQQQQQQQQEAGASAAAKKQRQRRGAQVGKAKGKNGDESATIALLSPVGLGGHSSSVDPADGLDRDWHAAMRRTRAALDALLPEFLKQAEQQGWNLQQTMLNPKETRLMQLHPLLSS